MLTEAQEARWSTGAAGETASGGIGVTRLALTNFRNYPEARLALDIGPVVLTGPNGAGKTNLLEALSFLAPGRGLRGARLTEIDHRPAIEGFQRPLPRRLAGRSPQPSRRDVVHCASAPDATRPKASVGWCGSTASRRAARPHSASASAWCG